MMTPARRKLDLIRIRVRVRSDSSFDSRASGERWNARLRRFFTIPMFVIVVTNLFKFDIYTYIYIYIYMYVYMYMYMCM